MCPCLWRCDDILSAMGLPKLTEAAVRVGANPESFARGQSYYQSGAISDTAIQGNVLTGQCEGNSAPYYQVCAELDEAGLLSAECSCPYDWGGYCKHIVALLLTYVYQPQRFARRRPPEELLADVSGEDLAVLLAKLMREQPGLYDRIEATLATPSAKGASKRTRRKKVEVDVYRRQIRNILHSLDGMRASEAYGYVGGLTNQLREVEQSARKFLDAGDAALALEILLVLLEEVGQSVEYVDDSDGYLGGFTSDLGQPLAEAILSQTWSEVEREKLVQHLTGLQRALGDYGMDDGLYLALQAANRGWETTPTTLAPRASARVATDEEDEEREGDFDKEAEWDEADGEDAGYYGSDAGDLNDAKLNVLNRQGCVDQYLALCLEAQRHLRYALKLCELDRVAEGVTHAKKYFTTAEEAVELGERLRELKHIPEALAIGERGLKLASPRQRLGEWLGPVEEAQGRPTQALKAWLVAFPESPTLETYKTLKRLAGKGWRALRPKVMAMLKKAYSSQALAEVLLYEEEWDEAIQVAERREAGYTEIEIVVEGVMPHRAEWAAKMATKQAERLMAEPKSNNYPIAAAWLQRTKKAYELLGQTAAWKKYLEKIKEQYKRRPALQAQFKRL
jgi:uncharacterized Zn finger protein